MRLLPKCGSFWSDAARTPVTAALVTAQELILRGAAVGGDATGVVVPWKLATADRLVVDGPSGPRYGYPVPAWLDGPAYAATAVGGTGTFLVAGADYTLSDGRAWFSPDPLADTALAAKSRAGGPVEVIIWAFAAPAATTPLYRKPGTYAALTAAVAAATDVPCFTAAGTVLDVKTLYSGRTVVTTQTEALTLPDGCTAVVDPGDTVAAGDPAGDAWRLVRLSPDTAEPVVAVGLQALPAGLTGVIGWPNTLVSVTRDVVSGRTRARFPLIATNSADITAFWAACHTLALTGKVSVAQMLDTRPIPSGEPDVTDVAAVVNPAVFLGKLVGGCGYMLVTTSAKFGPNALDAASRTATIAEAAGPGCGVFEFDGGPPTGTPTLP